MRDGVTIDQLIAQKIGQDNLMPSLQLASRIPARIRATAAKATAAPTRTRFPGRRPPSRCPWKSIRRWSSSACSETAVPPSERAAPRRRPQHSGSSPATAGRLRDGHQRRPIASASTSISEDVREIERRLSDCPQGFGHHPDDGDALRRAVVLRRTHQAAVRFAGAGVPGRHHSRLHHSLRTRSHRPRVSGKRHPTRLPRRLAPRRRIPPTFSITRKSTPIT